MALERPPRIAKANLAATLSYRPNPDQIFGYHTVADGRRETWGSIAKENQVPVEKLIACNFPGAIVKGKVVPEIVNWYLGNHNAFRCPETRDKKNRRFRGGEKVAIPLLGRVDIEEPIFLPPKKPTKLDDKGLSEYSDVIPGQKFSHEFRIPPKNAKPDKFIAGYLMYIFKINIEGEIAPKAKGDLQGKTQWKKDSVKAAVEKKFNDDLKGSLSVKYDGKYIEGIQKALKSRDKAQIVAAFLAPFEATLKEKYESRIGNFSPEIALEGSMTPIGAKIGWDMKEPFTIDGLKVECKFGVKVAMNVGLSPAGWAKVIEKIGPEAVKAGLRAAGAELAAVWEYLVAEGIVAGAGILAAAVAGALALTALMAWAIKTEGDRGERRGIATWYVTAYSAKVFRRERPSGFIIGDTKLRDQLILAGEADAIATARKLMVDLKRPEANGTDAEALDAYFHILLDIDNNNESTAKWRLEQTLTKKSLQLVGLE